MTYWALIRYAVRPEISYHDEEATNDLLSRGWEPFAADQGYFYFRKQVVDRTMARLYSLFDEALP